ncbi:hypothetical protein S23_59990 [Bradyrhizobium cosmicum]|uniref:CD-NTase-associated protein 12/Pycsar effector protein TIR domain-containing protein n=2 Tax=Bradyrhizobium cosmicum TaxID=1404864 RepID=A0AAI8MJU8_9BRAD|nr:hypothetical protein S23_59990 [Bradyrhizobium cosmicum]
MIAKDLGLGYQRYATDADRAEMRGAPAPIKHQFVNIPAAPAAKEVKRVPAVAKPIRTTRNNSLFVVHGRDTRLTEDMFALLRALGLNPLEWSQAVQNVPGANPNIGKIVHTALKQVQGVIVMFSPDEQAKLKSKFASPKDKRDRLHLLEGQSRPNVIFEAGIALGAHAEKTLLVEVGEVRKISDIDGMHILHLNNSAASRKELAQRLRKLKFKVDTSGTSWLTTGNFDR